MKTQLTLDPRKMPEEGTELRGELSTDLFDLPESDSIRPSKPVSYDLRAIRDGSDLILSGSLEAQFDLECVRCLEKFPQRVDLPHYQQDIPIEKEAIIDLTTWIREDILLALPSYPRCEDGNVEPRTCPAEGQFEETSQDASEDPPEGDSGAWDVLNKL